MLLIDKQTGHISVLNGALWNIGQVHCVFVRLTNKDAVLAPCDSGMGFYKYVSHTGPDRNAYGLFITFSYR